MTTIDKTKFKTMLHWTIRTKGLPLTPADWEHIVAYSTGSRWVGKARDLADCVHDASKTIISVKAAVKEPHIRKRKDSRDFISHPDYYDIDNLRQVGRRCGLPKTIDDQTDDPRIVGLAAWENYKATEKESLEKYSCENSLDISIIHSVSSTGNEYLVRISGYDHDIQDVEQLVWKDNVFGPGSKYVGNRANVVGYRGDIPVMSRNGGRGGHEQNCFFRYYKLDEALWSETISIPLPKQQPFDFDTETSLMTA
jgi:hypothetical protein